MAENLSRVENDLSVLNDGTGTVVPPMSRVEVFLHKLLGEEMPNLIPQSRVEELLLELYDKEITGDIIPKEITENGIYNASSENKDGYNPVTINVQPPRKNKTITQNGSSTATDDSVYGYLTVTVAIPNVTERSW